ncbi:MAG: hypothetical protein ACKUBY_05405 [Candidatus Moraniibacteriota bacterium]|jgi:hypothetical protein
MAGVEIAKGYDRKIKEVEMPEACKTCEHKEKGCFEHCEFFQQRMLYEKNNKD